MNPMTSIPARYRLVAYVVYGVGSLVMTYLGARHLVGADEMALWSGLGVLLGLTAASNVGHAPEAR
jgi:hypothetical protein